MLNIPLFTESRKTVTERCKIDPNTRLLLKYSPYYHVVDQADGVDIVVGGKRMLMMTSNEYLGLSQHPKVKEATQEAVRRWGTSPCGSRLANGSRAYHVELEEELADFLGKEACHVTSAGYLSCMASISSLAQRGDALILDKSVHSSLWDGTTLSGATIERFLHNDMNSLKALMEQLDPGQPKIIVVDGVYSMEGHIAPLAELVEIAKKFDAVLVVDDAHGLGVLGKNGRGVLEHFNLNDEVELVAGGFSKSLASTGGFIVGKRFFIEYLRSSSRQIIFSAAIAPPAAAAAQASLRIMRDEPEHRQKLWDNTRYFQKILDGLGLDYWESPTPAIPIVIGNKEKCYFMWKSLWEQGFFTVMAVSPGVPVGKDLIRTAVTALHTHEQLDRFGEALKTAMKATGVQPRKK